MLICLSIKISQVPHQHRLVHVLEQTKHRPLLGIVCGSGLGDLSGIVEDADMFEYKDITGSCQHRLVHVLERIKHRPLLGIVGVSIA